MKTEEILNCVGRMLVASGMKTEGTVTILREGAALNMDVVDYMFDNVQFNDDGEWEEDQWIRACSCCSAMHTDVAPQADIMSNKQFKDMVEAGKPVRDSKQVVRAEVDADLGVIRIKIKKDGV